MVWAGAYTLTHLPQESLPETHIHDYTLHGGGYFILAGVFWLALRAYGVSARRRALWVAAAMTAYGALDELTQPLVGRSDSVSDWSADLAGAALALAVCEALARVRSKRTPKP